MAKYVVFSFDDGRYDTYQNAAPIMEKHGVTATINITTDFILHPSAYTTFNSADNTAMSVDNILDMQNRGFEIAVHGNWHINDPDDVRTGVALLKEWGIESVYGFASPESSIDEGNFGEFEGLLKDGTVSYIRSGLQVRKQGLFYAGLYVLQNIFKSKFLFYILNKRTIIKKGEERPLIYGVSVSKDTTAKQIMYLLKKAPDNSAVVFIFHSILNTQNAGYGQDKWYWSESRFDKLCKLLSNSDKYKTVKSRDIFKI